MLYKMYLIIIPLLSVVGSNLYFNIILFLFYSSLKSHTAKPYNRTHNGSIEEQKTLFEVVKCFSVALHKRCCILP